MSWKGEALLWEDKTAKIERQNNAKTIWEVKWFNCLWSFKVSNPYYRAAFHNKNKNNSNTGTESNSVHCQQKKNFFSPRLCSICRYKQFCVRLKPNLIQYNTKLITKSSPSSKYIYLSSFGVLVQKGSNGVTTSRLHSFHPHRVFISYSVALVAIRI